MIWDEAESALLLDVPVLDELAHLASNNPKAVRYLCDISQNTWTKEIILDHLDRSSLASLLVHLNQLQNLSPYRLLYDGSVPTRRRRLDVSLPVDIRLSSVSLSLIYQLSPYGCASTLLSRAIAGLPESIVCAIISRAVVCLADLHDQCILHRAIQACHLLLVPVDKAQGHADEVTIQLCGLGSLTQVTPRGSIIARNDLPFLLMAWRGWHYQGERVDISVDTPWKEHPASWYSPEMLAQDFIGYSKPSDIYSLGLTMAELFTGGTPYALSAPSLIFLKKMTRTDHPSLKKASHLPQASKEMLEVFESITQFSPTRRPTAIQLLHVPWIQYGLQQPLTVDALKEWLPI